MTLLLRARPVSRMFHNTMHPAYDVYQGTMQIPDYSLVAVADGWRIIPVAGPYGIMYDQKQNARVMNRDIRGTMTMFEALAIVRRVLEAFDAECAAEAAAELETERRAEAFWENRMSDEDKAREDWEYGMFGA